MMMTPAQPIAFSRADKRRAKQVAKERGLEVVDIEELVRDPRLQPRLRLNDGTIHQYGVMLANGSPMPPVKAMRVEDLVYLTDGWHRTLGAERRNLHLILADVSAGTFEDAQWAAASANLLHGLPLSRKEIRLRVFPAYMAARRYRNGREIKSCRTIALELGGGISHTTVLNWMKERHPKVYARMQRNGEGLEERGGKGQDWPSPAAWPSGEEESVRVAWQTVAALLPRLATSLQRAYIRDMRRDLENWELGLGGDGPKPEPEDGWDF